MGPAKGNLKSHAERGKSLLDEEKDIQENELGRYLDELKLKNSQKCTRSKVQ